ncbi:MAG: type II toxin-antitoxin system VapC family toxin [Acetobacteraceae bacterium]|nr:type II toxin-antitoxin system VapC family toxin [Acetobacteraceae bacterium]
MLDASVMVAWCFRDEATPATAALLESMDCRTAWVPGVWHFEVANLLTQAERRGRVTEQSCATFIDILNALPIEIDVDPYARALGPIRNLARVHNLMPYDAAYLDLALRRMLPLATRDRHLQRAATAAAIVLLQT